MTRIAPVVLLGYARPEFTARVFEQIRRAQPEQLFLVMDGPRSNKPGDADNVKRTRELAEQVDWDCTVTRLYSDVNLGLKKRVSSGLTEVFSKVPEAIILEDDCLPDPSFFPYATELLERYREDPRVGVISGSSRLRGKRVSPYSYDFSADVRIWGWATWARTWNPFIESGDLDPVWSSDDVETVVESLPSGARRSSVRTMMSKAAELDSWAMPFVVHCLRRGYANPVPADNLVSNIGFGSLSTHTKFESYVAEVSASAMAFPMEHPPEVVINRALDVWESRRDRWETFRYPLTHPFDTAGRLLRYGRTLLRREAHH
ncbi:MAG: hypothetical protein K9G09_03560 [Pontimonas sp.]|nr:hypothetical protein [Pontimonas sp.]